MIVSWAGGAQNDSHSHLGCAKAMTAAVRRSVPAEVRFLLGEELADLLEETSSAGFFNFYGSFAKLVTDPAAREADWRKAMGMLAHEPVAAQGGTFAVGLRPSRPGTSMAMVKELFPTWVPLSG